MMHALFPILLTVMVPQEPDLGTMVSEARLDLSQAIQAAMREARTGVVVKADLEFELNRVVWSLDVAQGKKVLEVLLDARDGSVVERDEEAEDCSAIVQAAKVGMSDAAAAIVRQTRGKAVMAELHLADDKPVATVAIFKDGGRSEFRIGIGDASAGLKTGVMISQTFDFSGVAENAVPQGIKVGMTGDWKATKWGVHYLDGNAVLAHVGFWDEDPEGIFPVAWVEDARTKDLTLGVKLFPVTPPAEIANSEHDGTGIVFRFKDPDNYYLLRAVPHETRVRFYKVENGKRSTLAGKDIEIPTGRWHELELTAQGSTFTARFNGEKLFTHEDRTFTEAGSYGFWCKPNNVTYYDDLRVEILDK